MPAIAQPDQHQLSKRQQYETMIQAEAGPSTRPLHDPASIQAHPSYPFLSNLATRYPTQSSALFQTYLDLKHAAGWAEVSPTELLLPAPTPAPTPAPALSAAPPTPSSPTTLVTETLQAWKTARRTLPLPPSTDGPAGWAAIRARRNAAAKLETILPIPIEQQLNPALFRTVFDVLQLESRSVPLPESAGETGIPPTAAGSDLETDHILLSMMAQDSTLVYYRLSKGLVKPVN